MCKFLMQRTKLIFYHPYVRNMAEFLSPARNMVKNNRIFMRFLCTYFCVYLIIFYAI